MQLITVVLLAISTVCLADAQSGVIGLQPLDPKLLTDLNQYVPEKRIKFKWEIKQREKEECVCPEPVCPQYLNEASVSIRFTPDPLFTDNLQLSQCRINNALACYQRSNGACPKP
jgi:hypothetical protein